MTISQPRTAMPPRRHRTSAAPADRPGPSHVAIVGGGLGGLGAAHYLLQRAAAAELPLRVTVIEAADRPGGKVLTEHVDGFVLEGGPDSLLATKPKALELARELGLGDRLLGSDDARRRVLVERGGRLVEVPPGLKLMVPTRLGPFLRSPLFSWPGKLRILAERFVPPRRSAGETSEETGAPESLAAFVRRRLGREALERLADPVMSSIHLGDPERLDLAVTFPAFAEAERRFGSLTRAATHRTVAPRTDPARTTAARPAPGPLFYTLAGGLGELVDALATRLVRSGEAEIRLGRPVTAIGPTDETAGGGAGSSRRFAVRLAGGETLTADAVLLAVPAFAAARVLAAERPRLARELGELRHVSAATVALGYAAGALPATPEGFGFFVPAAADRAVVAATISSNKFAGRAPAGATLLRAFVGGARGEHWVDLPDDELVATVRREIEALLGIASEPCLVRLHRWSHGYPQYELGHPQRVAEIERQAGGGLYFAGSAYHGPGIPDTLASAERAGGALVRFLARSKVAAAAVETAAAHC